MLVDVLKIESVIEYLRNSEPLSSVGQPNLSSKCVLLNYLTDEWDYWFVEDSLSFGITFIDYIDADTNEYTKEYLPNWAVDYVHLMSDYLKVNEMDTDSHILAIEALTILLQIEEKAKQENVHI